MDADGAFILKGTVSKYFSWFYSFPTLDRLGLNNPPGYKPGISSLLLPPPPPPPPAYKPTKRGLNGYKFRAYRRDFTVRTNFSRRFSSRRFSSRRFSSRNFLPEVSSRRFFPTIPDDIFPDEYVPDECFPDEFFPDELFPEFFLK